MPFILTLALLIKSHGRCVGRLFRLLAAFNVVKEIAEDKFEPTPFSYAIGDESTKIQASLQGGQVYP